MPYNLNANVSNSSPSIIHQGACVSVILSEALLTTYHVVWAQTLHRAALNYERLNTKPSYVCNEINQSLFFVRYSFIVRLITRSLCGSHKFTHTTYDTRVFYSQL